MTDYETTTITMLGKEIEVAMLTSGRKWFTAKAIADWCGVHPDSVRRVVRQQTWIGDPLVVHMPIKGKKRPVKLFTLEQALVIMTSTMPWGGGQVKKKAVEILIEAINKEVSND